MHQLLPEEFIKKLPRIVSENMAESVLESFNHPKPSTFRANTLRISPENLEVELKKRSIPYERITFLPNAFMLRDIPQKEFTKTDLYNNGFIYIQSISSMVPPLVLNPEKDNRVLDLTAAPGSKTTQMAALMNNQGKIIANDNSTIRIYKLQANLKIQGVINTEVTHMDARQVWKIYPEYFDKVLVDVPCSMEGRFLTSYSKSFKDWSQKKVKILSQLQKFILRSAVSATRVGGEIVYSTCTLSPEENEEVIAWILDKERGNVELIDIDISIPGFVNGITSWQGKSLPPSIEKTKRILPSSLMEGFYVAKFKKLRSSVPKNIK